jgi:hypothetical protein
MSHCSAKTALPGRIRRDCDIDIGERAGKLGGELTPRSLARHEAIQSSDPGNLLRI